MRFSLPLGQIMNSKSSTPHGTQSGAIFNFGNKDKKNQDMDDL